MSQVAVAHSIAAKTRSTLGHAVLIGSNHQENLALQYLAASLQAKGFTADLVGFNERPDVSTVLRAVKAAQPSLVGLQVAFQFAVDDCIWLARALREDGYRGHLTAGGHVATFCYRELLAPGMPFDSVVRHEGEVALCEMVERLAASEGVDGIAGCVTASRLQQGTPAPRPLLRDLDVLPRPVRPSEPYLVAGVPIAFCITTRGCHGDCNYCCINAFTRDAGGPRYRLRHAEEVAGEFAELAQRGVQALFLQDDLFVLPSEQAALRRFAELQRACRQKDVPPLVLWIKGRPESITVPVLEAAQELGALHIFLGIENASPERLRYLGRTHGPQDAERALALCGQVGMHASFNVMLFDPESTLEQVEENFDFLERHAEHPWNVCRTEIYPGTHLFERLQREGRLLGDFRSWGYRMSDPRAELLFRILRVSLLDRAFAATSLLNRLISLAFAWQLHSRLFPGVESEAVAAQAQRLGREAREDTVQMLRRAAEWVRQWPEESLLGGQDAHFNRELSRFAAAEGLRAAQRDFPRHQLAERLWDWLHARGAHHQRTAQRGAARPLHPGL